MNRFHRLALGLGLSALALSAAAQGAPRKNYLVQLADKPAASYEGGVGGLAATRPAPGNKLRVDASHVQAYLRFGTETGIDHPT